MKVYYLQWRALPLSGGVPMPLHHLISYNAQCPTMKSDQISWLDKMLESSLEPQ